VRLLKAKLDPKYIRTRNSNGSTLSYVEGWYAIAEANRIFGYEAWDRRTVIASWVWSEAKAGSYRAVYTAKVRITVRAGALWEFHNPYVIQTYLGNPLSPGPGWVLLALPFTVSGLYVVFFPLPCC
jgi:hypothetical protein